eukprot:1549189-Pyramimonas_sp.AAC.1
MVGAAHLMQGFAALGDLAVGPLGGVHGGSGATATRASMRSITTRARRLAAATSRMRRVLE